MSTTFAIRSTLRSTQSCSRVVSRSFGASANSWASAETASASSSSTSTAPPLPVSQEEPQSSTVFASAAGELPTALYRIPRTASGELPVYSKLRRGNMWKTIVRNVEGDVGALQLELNSLLQQTHIDPLRPAPHVTMRPTNRHLEVRGRRVTEIKEWLEARGH